MFETVYDGHMTSYIPYPCASCIQTSKKSINTFDTQSLLSLITSIYYLTLHRGKTHCTGHFLSNFTAFYFLQKVMKSTIKP